MRTNNGIDMFEVITSNKNKKIKEISSLQKQKKARTESGCFCVEGVRIVCDVIRSASELIREIYLSESFREGANSEEIIRFAKESGTEVYIVRDDLFSAMCETVTPQGVLAVVRQPKTDYEKLINKEGSIKLLVLEDIQDPGNLGTMVRTAEAAGISGIIMSKGTVDIFSPKVTRSTMGSVFRVPFMYTENLCETLDLLRKDGIEVYAAYLHGGVPYEEVAYSERAAVLIGNEGNGLSEEAVAHASRNVYIPMAGEVESLNAAIAAALMMFRIR